jgi:flagellar biosynthesis/type III secretory pathway chaperone
MSVSLRLIDMPQSQNTEQQFALVGQLLEILDTEFSALEAGDADAVSVAASHKLRLLKMLDPMACARLAEPQRDRLDTLLHQAQASNLRNGEFIATQHAYVRARWAGLASIAGLPNLYNADGISGLPSKPRASLGQA